MPFMKVNLNGRKYVISGLNDHTSSKNILYSLARADSTFHLETTCTEFSDTSVENEDRTKGSRIKRTRRTRVRRSSTSSVEIVQLDKDHLKGALAEKKLLIDLESSEWSEEQGIISDISKLDKSSHVICTECHATHSKNDLQCNSCKTKEVLISSSESQIQSNECNATCIGQGLCGNAKKTEVKRRKRKSRKRPVSQDVTEWKEKKDESEEKSDKIGEKGWKSADDVRDLSAVSSKKEKSSDKKREDKHKRKHKLKQHSNKIDNRSRKNEDKTITIGPVDNPTEYCRAKRHNRKELGDLRIQKMISRTIDERFVNFHLACMKSYTATQPVSHQGNEQEIRARLIQLVESQQKCLSALKKADKQNKKSMSRYTKYLKLDPNHLKLYGKTNGVVKTKVERTRKTSETDTGISEMHSDSSAEHTLENEPSYVISDDSHRDDVKRSSSSSHSVIKNAKFDSHVKNDVNSESDVIFENNGEDNESQKPVLSNCVVTVDAVAIDDVRHDVRTYVYEKDDDTRSEIIVAEPTGVVSPSGSTSLVPYRSVESVNTSTLSDNSESSFQGDCDDVEELRRVLMQEQQREKEKRRELDRRYQEMKLMHERVNEHDKMVDILQRLKDLNEGLVANENTDKTDLQQEKASLEKSIKLSVNLYEYQKGEITKNCLGLEQIESQVRRKRWHVESAVRELERIVSSPSRSQLDRIRSFESLPASIAGLTISSDVTYHTLV